MLNMNLQFFAHKKGVGSTKLKKLGAAMIAAGEAVPMDPSLKD